MLELCCWNFELRGSFSNSRLRREALEKYHTNRQYDQDPCSDISKNDPVPRAPRRVSRSGNSRRTADAERVQLRHIVALRHDWIADRIIDFA